MSEILKGDELDTIALKRVLGEGTTSPVEFVTLGAPSLDMQRGGLVEHRAASVIVRSLAAALPAAPYDGRLVVNAAPHLSCRIVRVQAYVEDPAAVADEFGLNRRTLDQAMIVGRQGLTRDFDVPDSQALTAPGSAAGFASPVQGDVYTNALTRGAAVTELTWEPRTGWFLDGTMGFLAFIFRRTPGALDDDDITMAIDYVTGPRGTFPPA